MKTSLQAHVEAVNLCNSLINKYQPLFQNAVAPFVGKKVLKANGELLEKVKAVLPVKTENNVQFWFDQSNYSLRYGIRVWVNSERNTAYHESTFYFGSITDGVLDKIDSLELPKPTSYDAQTVEQLQKNLQIAEENLSKAKNALYPFKPFYY